MKHTVKEVELKNGAKGLLIHIPDATVMDYEFNFRAGEYLVSRDKWEVPHLMEHMLLGANEVIKKARVFQAEFEKNGAYSNAFTSVYHVSYEAECADFEWKRILELLLLAISKPLFLREEFKAEFGNVKDELVSRSNDHFRHLNAVAHESYGLLAMTDRERLKQMKNVKRADLIEHYKRTHVTNNMRFIIAGNLARREPQIIKLIEGVKLAVGDPYLHLPDERPTAITRPIFVFRPSVKNLYFYIDTFAHIRFTDPETDALELVNTMLTATLYSRILGEARERGLVYSMGSGFSATRDDSAWWFGAQVIPKNAPALFEIIVRELLKIKSGDIDSEDIEAAKQYLLGRHQRSAQTVSGTVAGYEWRYYFDNQINNYHAIPDRINAVSKDKIVLATKRMFSDQIGGLALLGGNKARAMTERLDEIIKPLWD